MEDIKIVEFSAEYSQAFHDLNEWWISKYFQMEESDRKALLHPQSYIIGKGGYILFAIQDDVPLGTCALIKLTDGPYDYELAKMGVHPEAHGQGIGYELGKAVLQKAKKTGAKSLFLESNRKLAPALQLYKKLGFTEIINNIPSEYSRSDIQMEFIF